MPVDANGKYYSIYESECWYPMPKGLTQEESDYLYMLESIWRVKSGGLWVPYQLAPHQVDFHLHDVILKEENAQIRVVKKSRNTSFTVSSIISILMSIGDYKNDVVPFVRINIEKAKDMLKIVKGLVQHMKPIVYDYDGVDIYWPFNPKHVDFSAAGSVKFKDNNGDVVTEIRAFPANADSSESIRGIRTRGDSGILDETNFMRWFDSLFTALKDSSEGKVKDKEGVKKKIHQFSIGTTLKGETPFSEWLEGIEKKGSKRIKIFDWPVFDRAIFDTTIPFQDNTTLQSIVPWHDKEELWDDWELDEHTFKEEFMAIKVDSDDQFYPTALTLGRCNVLKTLDLKDFDTLPTKFRYIWGGVDVATSHDYFVISLFGEDFNGRKSQCYLEYVTKVELDDMEKKCELVFDRVQQFMKKEWYTTIDSVGIGLQITQNLKRRYPSNCRGVTGGGSIKDTDGNTHKLNAYGHTVMKRMMVDGTVDYINDEMLIKHYGQFDYTFKAPSTGIGHGDITMANLYALLPKNLKRTDPPGLRSTLGEEEELTDEEVEKKKNEFMELSMRDRMAFYKKNKPLRYGKQ